MARVQQVGDLLRFYCLGCGAWHAVNDRWKFNGNFALPTLQPSVLLLLTTGHFCAGFKQGENCWCTYAQEHPDKAVPFQCARCHTFITDGRIQYLSDCSHALAGQTVDLPEIEDIEKETAMARKGNKPTEDKPELKASDAAEGADTGAQAAEGTQAAASSNEDEDEGAETKEAAAASPDAELEDALRKVEEAQKAEAAQQSEAQPEQVRFVATVETVEFLVERGYKVDDVVAAQKFVDMLQARGQLGSFIADFERAQRGKNRSKDHGVTGLTLVCPACGSLTQRYDNAWQCTQDGGCGAFGKEQE